MVVGPHTHTLRQDVLDVANDAPVDRGPLVWSAFRGMYVPRALVVADLPALSVDNLTAAAAAWTTWTPTITQSATITKTVNQASYQKVGRRVSGSVHLTTTSTGTFNNDLIVSYPGGFTPVDTSFGVVGHGFINNTIGGTSKPLVVLMATASGFKFGIDAATLWNTEALVSGAIVGFRFDFEATS